MAKNLADHCVYTIVHPERLAIAEQKGGSTILSERRPWVTGLKLWNNAQSAGVEMPVLLGNANDCSDLRYWGLITKLEVTEAGTSFTVDRVRRFRRGHKPQELVLRSTGKHIAPNFIRPYAVCQTPNFVGAAIRPGD